MKVGANLLVRVAFPLTEDRVGGTVMRLDAPAVVMSPLENVPESVEWEKEDRCLGWVIYWYHPRHMTCGILNVINPQGGALRLPFPDVFAAICVEPSEHIRAAARLWLADEGSVAF